MFADVLRRACFSKAVSDPLGRATLDVQALRQMRGVKRARQIVGDDLQQVARRAKADDPVQREQLLILGGQGATIFWLAVVIQPGVFLLIGLIQFWRRRYASS